MEKRVHSVEVDGRQVLLGSKGNFILSLLTTLMTIVLFTIMAAAPLVLSLGIGYVFSSITDISLPISTALALGSSAVAILFMFSKDIHELLNTLSLIKNSMLYTDEEEE